MADAQGHSAMASAGAGTEGERWAREELALLRSARFAPPAVARFLVRSQRRANVVRADRPATAARMRAWVAAGALAWMVLAAARVSPFGGRVRAGLGWWAATAVMLDWHLGMLESEDGDPRNLGPADALTLLRAWLIPAVALDGAPVILVLGGATDLLDGVVARATVPTRAGRDLEGLVDACFAAAALRGAVRSGQLHPGVAALELARLGVGFVYGVTVYFAAARRPDPAVLRAARLCTPVRLGGLLAAATGRRRTGATTLAAGSLWSIVTVARALLARGQ